MKKYHTLLERDDSRSPWFIMFGSYVRSEVSYERVSQRDRGVRAKNLMIIVTGDGQADINAKVDALNLQQEGVVKP